MAPHRLRVDDLARLNDLACTNDPPQAAELAAIRLVVAEAAARLAAVDAQLSRLRELEEERAALSRYLARTSSIASPLRRVPPEILADIFSRASPWVVTHVCRLWRAVALSTPSLWSVVTLDFAARRQYPRERLEAQIQRAQALEVHFRGAELGDSHAQVELFQLLLDVAHRWVRLEVRLTSHLVPPLMDHAGDLTALRRAAISWDSGLSQARAFDAVYFLRMAVHLVDVQVLCRFRFLPTELPLFALDHLTRYDLDAPWSAHRELLRSLPRLEEVRIHHAFDDGGPAAEDPVSLPRVRRLHVTRPATLDRLRAPSVRELGAWGEPADGEAIGGHLERFLARSSCSPRALALRGVFVEALVAVLGRHACFRRASVLDAAFVDGPELLATLLALAARMPHVTAVGLALEEARPAAQQLFLSMLEARRGALEAAELVSRRAVDLCPRTVGRIEALRAAGLRAEILSGQAGEALRGRWLLAADWV